MSIIDRYMDSGEFADANEVIEHSLAIMENEEKKIRALRVAILEREESGIAENFSFKGFRKKMTAKYAE